MRPLYGIQRDGNRKERLRVREAGASAAGRGQRPYASFPDRQPYRTPRSPIEPSRASTDRQVSLRSLTTISWRAFVCFFGLNPFQLQNASHSALKLHLPFFEMGLRWAAAQTRLGLHPKPRQGTSFPAPSLRFAAT